MSSPPLLPHAEAGPFRRGHKLPMPLDPTGGEGRTLSCSAPLGCGELKTHKSTFVWLHFPLLSHCQKLQQQHSERV